MIHCKISDRPQAPDADSPLMPIDCTIADLHVEPWIKACRFHGAYLCKVSSGDYVYNHILRAPNL